jgi:polygalacturonase
MIKEHSMTTNINNQRRNLMKALPAAGLSFSIPAVAATAPDPWLQAQAIVDHVSKPLRFRKQDFAITAYGAKTCKLTKVKAWISFEEQDTIDTPAAGSPDCYAAIAAAIKACSAAGGGRVVIPAGNWYCAGPIVLLSNVNVHLKAGAHVYFSHNPADYAKYGDIDCGKHGKLSISRWQSNDCLNYSSMIYAYGQNNIALTGDDWTSTLDGQGGVPFNEAGDCWWTWKGKQKTINSVGQGTTPNFVAGKMSENTENPLNAMSLATVAPALTEEERVLIQGEGQRWRADAQYLPALSEAGVPLSKRVFGIGHYLRPPMIQIIGCTNVLLQGYHVTRTPFWMHHPVHCRNIVIRNVHAHSHGPNSDGFDPEACDHVLVEGCTFDTGDDCIAIKAGKDLDTQYGPSQNIVIQNCIMHSGHGAVTLGSEMAGGIQNVFAQKLVFENANWKTNPLNTAIRLKTNMNPVEDRRHGSRRHRHLRLRLHADQRQRPYPSAGREQCAYLERQGRQRQGQGRQGRVVLSGHRDPRPGGVRLQRPAADAASGAGDRRDHHRLRFRRAGQHRTALVPLQRQGTDAEERHHRRQGA